MRIKLTLLAIALLLPTSCYATSNTSNISGHIYITLGSGESQTIRGNEIFLLPCSGKNVQDVKKINEIKALVIGEADKFIQDMMSEMKNNIQNRSSSSNTVTRTRLANATVQIGQLKRFVRLRAEYLVKNVKFSTRTNYEGIYSFKDLAEGNYYIFSIYQTNFDNGLWFVPISLSKGQSLELDLSNFNLEDEKHLKELISMCNTAINSSFQLLNVSGRNEIALLQEQENVEKVIKLSEEGGVKFDILKDFPVAGSQASS